MTTKEFVDKWELDTLTIVDIEASDTLIARIDERDAAFRATVAAALEELRAEMIKLSKTVEGNLEDEPSCDEEHDYNAGCRGMIKGISECAVKLDATIAKLSAEVTK